MAATSDQPRRPDDQRRPQQIELLLDAEGPVVLERRRGSIRGEVVGAGGREPVVADVQRGGDPVAQGDACLQRRQDQRGTDRGDDQHQRPGREQPSGARPAEAGHPDGAGGHHVVPQQPRDEKAGEDEEHVDPDEPTPQPGHTGVEQHHGQHRDGAQALDVGAERAHSGLDGGGRNRRGGRGGRIGEVDRRRHARHDAPGDSRHTLATPLRKRTCRAHNRGRGTTRTVARTLSNTRGTATSPGRASAGTSRGPRRPRRSCTPDGWPRRRTAAGPPARRPAG